MKSISLLLIPCIFILTAGCTQTRVAYVQRPDVEGVPIPNEANVKFPSKVKAYAVNRYIDPANPSLLHERHVVYRVEEESRWRLKTSTDRQIIIGNTLTPTRQEYAPARIEQELGSELQAQRQMTRKLSEHTGKIITGIQNVTVSTDKNRELVEKLAERVQVLEATSKSIPVSAPVVKHSQTKKGESKISDDYN
ncbi:MAG: hypothetical protein SGI71_02030 [Verrucomicrobiota bacterium]|nr:hypothetical protein [Verrucomicrobiota bacterium]